MALVGELTALMLSHLLMSSPSRNSYISSGYGFGSKPRVHALAADYGSQGTHQALSTHSCLRDADSLSPQQSRWAGRSVLWTGSPAAQEVRNPSRTPRTRPAAPPHGAANAEGGCGVRSRPACPWPSSAVAAVPREVY